MNSTKILAGVIVLAVVGVCVAVVPLAAWISLQFLYIEPNPRHLPPVLMGEAVGWSIIGLLGGAAITVVSDSLFWHTDRSLWTRYRGIITGAVVAMITGVALGIVFAIIQMDSVDGQAMETRQLAALAGATAGGVGTMAGIIAGAVLRRYVISLYRLPETQPSRITFNDEDATGTRRSVAGNPPERSSHAGEHP